MGGRLSVGESYIPPLTPLLDPSSRRFVFPFDRQRGAAGGPAKNPIKVNYNLICAFPENSVSKSVSKSPTLGVASSQVAAPLTQGVEKSCTSEGGNRL